MKSNFIIIVFAIFIGHANSFGKDGARGYLGKTNLFGIHTCLTPNLDFLNGYHSFENPIINSNNLSYGFSYGATLGKHVLVNFTYERKNSFFLSEYNSDTTSWYNNSDYMHKFKHNFIGAEFNFYPNTPILKQTAPLGWSIYYRIEKIFGTMNVLNQAQNSSLSNTRTHTERFSVGFRNTRVFNKFKYYTYGFNYGFINPFRSSALYDYQNWSYLSFHFGLGIIN